MLLLGGYLSSLSWTYNEMHRWLEEFNLNFHKLLPEVRFFTCNSSAKLQWPLYFLPYFSFQVESGFQPRLKHVPRLRTSGNEEHLRSELQATNSVSFPGMPFVVFRRIYEISECNSLEWMLWSWRSWHVYLLCRTSLVLWWFPSTVAVTWRVNAQGLGVHAAMKADKIGFKSAGVS